MEKNTKNWSPFFEKHFTQKIEYTRFTPSSRIFLKKIFRNIRDSNLHWNSIITTEAIAFNKVDMKHGKNYFNLPEFAKKKINELNNGVRCSFEIHGKNVNVYIYAKTVTNEFLYSAFMRIYMWLFVAYLYAPQQCSQQLDIYLYLTDLQKHLPEKQGEAIDVIHANTAFTTSCQNNTEINLFRYEEWFKVLIHETFHCLGLDFSTEPNHLTKTKILDLFHVDSQVYLSETYCEVWAKILNLAFVSYFQKVGDTDKRFVENMEVFINYERIWSLFQCCKVLNHYGMTYVEIITPLAVVSKKYKEKTNVLSYYIIHSVLIFYFNDFIEFCGNTNVNNGLQFSSDKHSLDKYVELIREHYNTADILKNQEIMNEIFRKNSKKTAEMRTLRMSLF
jgi:hypothetical protein